jgi:hypothetical protein
VASATKINPRESEKLVIFSVSFCNSYIQILTHDDGTVSLTLNTFALPQNMAKRLRLNGGIVALQQGDARMREASNPTGCMEDGHGIYEDDVPGDEAPRIYEMLDEIREAVHVM